jgi:hypothetical protein
MEPEHVWGSVAFACILVLMVSRGYIAAVSAIPAAAPAKL